MEAVNKPEGNEFVALPLTLVTEVLLFLQKKPYDEVAKLISDIHTKSRMVAEAPNTQDVVEEKCACDEVKE